MSFFLVVTHPKNYGTPFRCHAISGTITKDAEIDLRYPRLVRQARHASFEGQSVKGQGDEVK